MEPRSEPVSEASTKRSSRLAIAIGVAVILLGVIIAVGFGTVLVLRRSQGRPFRIPVGPDLPLAPGDVLGFERDGLSCDAVVLAVLPNGDIRMPPCRGRGEPIEVARSLLHVDAYRPDLGSAEVGDVVLARLGVGWERARVVSLEANHRIRIRPIRVAPNALAAGGPERAIAEREALGLQRRMKGPSEIWAPVGLLPLEHGDRLRMRASPSDGSVVRDVVVVASSGARVVVQPRIGERDDGPPTEVDASTLEARIVRPRDTLEVGDVLFEPTPDGMFRRVFVLHGIDEFGESCVRGEEGGSCHDLPVTGLFRVSRVAVDEP